jgi:hypothetical protein
MRPRDKIIAIFDQNEIKLGLKILGNCLMSWLEVRRYCY